MPQQIVAFEGSVLPNEKPHHQKARPGVQRALFATNLLGEVFIYFATSEFCSLSFKLSLLQCLLKFVFKNTDGAGGVAQW